MTSQPRVALVTGATQRLGAHLARTLGDLGWHVLINSRSHEGGAGELEGGVAHGSMRLIRADVSSRAEVAAMFADVRDIEGRLDLLINNVGVYIPKPLMEVTLDEWDVQIQTNLSGAFYCCHAALPLLEATGGQVINIGYAGVERLQANPAAAPYEISKVGLLILTRSLAAAYGPRGVRCNMISPGQLSNSVDLPDDLAAEIPLGRAGTLDDVAQAMEYLLGADYVTGTNINVAGGYRL